MAGRSAEAERPVAGRGFGRALGAPRYATASYFSFGLKQETHLAKLRLVVV